MGITDNLKIPQKIDSAQTNSIPQSSSITANLKLPSVSTAPSTPTSTIASGVKLPSTGASPYYYGSTPSGGTIGHANETDVSGRPFLDYRNPGDTATSTDRTRVATTFDPQIAAPQTRESFANPRADQLREKYKKEMGIGYSDELDHKIALALSGSNARENLRSIPAAQNNDSAIISKLALDVIDGKKSLFEAQTDLAKAKGLPTPWTGKDTRIPGIDKPFTPEESAKYNPVTVPIGAKAGDTFVGNDGKKYEVQMPTTEDLGRGLYENLNPTSLIAKPIATDIAASTPAIGQGVIQPPLSNPIFDLLNQHATISNVGKNNVSDPKYPSMSLPDIISAAGTRETIKLANEHPEKIDPLVYLARGIGFGHDPVNEYTNWAAGFAKVPTLSDLPEPTTGAQKAAQQIGNLLTISVAAPAINSALATGIAEIPGGLELLNTIQEASIGSPWKVGYSVAIDKAFVDGSIFGLLTKNKQSIAKNVMDTGGSFAAFEAIAYPVLSFFKPFLKSVGKVSMEKSGLPGGVDTNALSSEPFSKTLWFENPKDPNQLLKITRTGIESVEKNAVDLNISDKNVGDTSFSPIKLTSVDIEAFKKEPSLYQKLLNWLSGQYQEFKATPNKQGGFAFNPFAPGESAGPTAKPAPFEGFSDLTTTTLDKLKGRASVSKQFISDLTNSPDLKQTERDTIRGVLGEYPDGKDIPVQEFADKVKAELLPLERKSASVSDKKLGISTPRYEGVTLPDDLRGNVANYDEHIYNSPIKTSAGDVHFNSIENPGYFGHTRTEDMADGITRRVIEDQSDLHQKNRIEGEKPNLLESSKRTIEQTLRREAEIKKLQQYTNPTAHFRMAREEIKQAAIDGKTKLQFPTGETAMKIEGLGVNADNWLSVKEGNTRLNTDSLKTGKEIARVGEQDIWIITDVLGDGKFKAVQQRKLLDPEYNYGLKSYGPGHWNVENGLKAMQESDHLQGFTETFDISGKVDTSNPIYRFYEKDLGRYLINKFGAKRIVDDKGVSWYEVTVPKEAAKAPVLAHKYHSLFSGPKATNSAIQKLIESKLPEGTIIRLIFDPQLIKKYNDLGQYREWQDVLTDETRKAIALYTSRGKSAVRTALHETVHALEAMMPKAMLDELNKETLASMTPADHRFYSDPKYNTPELRAAEFRADEQAKKWADEAGYKSRIQNILDKVNAFIKKIISAVKDVFNKIKKAYKESELSNQKGAIQNPLFEGPEKQPYKSPIENHLEELQTEKANFEEALANNPAKSLVRYVNPRTGELPEALGTGHSKFGKIGDQLAQELGFPDAETARVAYQNYAFQKKRIDAINKDIANVKDIIKGNKLTEKDAKSLRFFLDKNATKTEKQIKAIVSKEKTPETRAQLEKRKAIAEDRMNHLMQALQSTEAEITIHTPQTQLELAQTAQPISIEDFERLNSDFSYNKIVIDTNTPVKVKVGILDYLRTPDRVLQKIGLGNTSKMLRQAYENYLAELPLHLEVITDWSKRVDAAGNKRIFNWLDGQTNRDLHAGKKPVEPMSPEELKVAKEVKFYLKEWADRLGLPEDNKISHYITHIFNIGELEKEFDEDVAKIIRDQVPGSVYDPFLEKRLGRKGYIQDTWKALDAYVKRAVRKANMDPVLERLKAASGRLEESQYKYVERLAKRINLQPTEVDNLVDNTIKQLIGYRFGQRPTAYLSRFFRQMIFRSALGLNVGSAVKNLTQGVNTFAKLGPKYTTIGYAKLFTQAGKNELEEMGILKQDMIQDRALSAVRKNIQKMDKGLFIMFDMAEKINRGAAYFGAKAKGIAEGMSEEQAIEYAKKIVRDTQFQFGSIDTPVGLNSDITKFFTQFLTYGVKQAEFTGEMLKNKEWPGILRYILASTALVYFFGKMFNLKATDFIPGYSLMKFGIPPALAFPWEIFKAVVNAPDQFGKIPTFEQKLKNIGRQIPYPASVQAQKTARGLSAYNDPKSKVQKTPYNFTKGALLGQQNLTTEPPSAAKAILDKYKINTTQSTAKDILKKYGVK